MDLRGLESIQSSWWPVWISFVFSIIAIVRLYMAGPKCPSEVRIDNTIVLITGASSGIGLATARELAERGGKIILTCRNKEKGLAAVKYIKTIVQSAEIDLRLLDVSSMKSIRDFTTSLKKDYGRIDVLINNAGIIFHQHAKTPENLELTFATNYLGPFLLTHLLLPLLSRSDNGRVVNISAMAHYAAKFDVQNINFCKQFIYREAYGETKLAVVMFTKYMAKLLEGTKITVNAVSPGLVRDTDHLSRSPLASSWMTRVSVFPWTWLFLKTPRQGAQSIIYAAIDPMLDTTTGCYISDCEIKEPSELTKDEILLEKLYTKSCELCDIKPEELKKNL